MHLCRRHEDEVVSFSWDENFRLQDKGAHAHADEVGFDGGSPCVAAESVSWLNDFLCRDDSGTHKELKLHEDVPWLIGSVGAGYCHE